MVSFCRCILVTSVLTAPLRWHREKVEKYVTPEDMWNFRLLSEEELAKKMTGMAGVEETGAGMKSVGNLLPRLLFHFFSCNFLSSCCGSQAGFAALTPAEEAEGYHKVYAATMSHQGHITLKVTNRRPPPY